MIEKILKLWERLGLTDTQLLGAFDHDALCQAYEQLRIWEIECILSSRFSHEVVEHKNGNLFSIKGAKNCIEVTTKRELVSELLEKCKGNDFKNELAEDSLLDFVENDSKLGNWEKLNDTYYWRIHG